MSNHRLPRTPKLQPWLQSYGTALVRRQLMSSAASTEFWRYHVMAMHGQIIRSHRILCIVITYSCPHPHLLLAWPKLAKLYNTGQSFQWLSCTAAIRMINEEIKSFAGATGTVWFVVYRCSKRWSNRGWNKIKIVGREDGHPHWWFLHTAVSIQNLSGRVQWPEGAYVNIYRSTPAKARKQI